MKRYDAAVIGAGLAGLTFACELSSRGYSVLLLDRKETLLSPVHTTGIFVRKTFEETPFPQRFLGPPVRNVVLYSPSRRALSLSSGRDEFRVGNMGAIYQWMASRCAARGVEVILGAHFLRFDGERVCFRVRGEEQIVAARMIVGADGCSSRVARSLGLDLNAEWIVGAEEVLDGVPLEGEPRFECILDPRIAPGYLAWIVHDGAEVHLGVGGYAQKFEAARALAALRREAGRRFDFSRAEPRSTRGGRIPVGGVLRRIACRRGLLVGDAAGAVSPLTAGGLDGAIRLSRLAAKLAAASLERNDPSMLRGYSGDLFRARFVSRRWMRLALRVFAPAPIIEGVCALLRTPPGRALAWQVFFGRGSFPDVEIPLLLQSSS